MKGIGSVSRICPKAGTGAFRPDFPGVVCWDTNEEDTGIPRSRGWSGGVRLPSVIDGGRRADCFIGLVGAAQRISQRMSKQQTRLTFQGLIPFLYFEYGLVVIIVA